MIFELGKTYIVDVTEKGIVPLMVFDEDRWFDKDHDDLDFLTDEEKIVVINDVLDKIKAEIEEKIIPSTLGGIALKQDCLTIIDRYKADKKPTCGDCKEWGTVNCPETYREPTKSDDICDSFKADKGVEE